MLRPAIIGCLLISSLLSFARAEKKLRDSATVIIRLGNGSHPGISIDSVYLIFDRYDLTGAGVVKQVCYPVNNEVEITVPKGKYYIDLFCLGNYNKHFDWIVKAKPRKKNELALNLDDRSFFIPGFVSIPPEKIDPGNLSITSYASFK